MQVGEQFAKDLVTAGPDDSLTSVAQLMEQHNVGTVVIVQNQKPIGIVTDRDLALAIGAREFPPQTPAGQVMTVPVTTIDQRKEVADATWYMLGYEVRRLPIVDEKGRLVGIVTLDDLLRHLARQLANLADGIKPEMAVK
jgi:CBS domain-containing protein